MMWLKLCFLLTPTLIFVLLPQVQLPGGTKAAEGELMPPLIAAAQFPALPGLLKLSSKAK